MSAARYWRLTGISTPGNRSLELSEVRIFENGTPADTGASLSSTLSPTSGLISYLYDGLATNVVAWSHSKFNAPGFALVWDFGGGGVDAAEISFGTGADAGAFISDATLQCSEDGFTWVTKSSVAGVKYPGNNVLTPAKVASDANPSFNNVVLNLSLVGGEGSTVVVDSSAIPKTLTCVGDTKISSVKPRFGRPSLAFDGSGDSLVSPSNSNFNFGTAPFTIELQLYANSLANSPMLYTRMDSAATADSGWFIEVAANMVYFGWGAVGTQYIMFPVSLTTGAWHHLAVTRSGNTLNCFVNGVSPGALTHPNAALSHDKAVQISIGGDLTNFPTLGLNGYLAEIRITQGIVVYTSNFTPPSSLMLADGFLEMDATARLRNAPLGSPQYAVGAGIEDSAISCRSHGGAFLDSYNGGSGIVVGTVKEKNTPANTPLHRRVLLVDEASRIAIRETWSDPITGAFEFRGVKQGVKYSTISYDHLHNYRAVIADNQDAA